MNISQEEIEERMPVWEALSELFLDIKLDENDFKRIAVILKRSTFSIDVLESILYDEIYPVCIPNLLSVAGEWTGFDSNWLKRSIIKRQQRKLFKFKGSRLNKWMIREEWNKIKILMKSK